ncbi:MAG: hypothetical protein E7050_01085 [Lentisphaerae bacterium]|nr:hypothetical protein [Lentisphaerota bacterium]
MKKTYSIFLFLITFISFSVTADYHHTFEKNTGGWVSYNYWGGKTELSSEAAYGGKKSMKLTATEYRGKIYGLCILPVVDSNLCGKKVSVSFYAKGKGSIKAGILYYTRNSRGGENMIYDYCEPVTLNDQWQKVEFIADFADIAVEKIAPAIRIDGEGYAFIDEAKVVIIKPGNISVAALDKHQIVRSGSALSKLRFRVSTPGADVTFFTFSENRKQQVIKNSASSDGQGQTAYTDQTVLPAGEVSVIAAAGGANSIHYSYVMPETEYDDLDAIAKTISLNKPLHILYIGDSLADRDRGHNFTDKLVWWLNKYNPGKVSLQNLAVSGDFITRVESRMKVRLKQSRESVWKQYVYNDLFNRPYDLIIISLGHNDCASFKKSNYRQPQVSLSAAEAAYKNVIAMLRSKSKAPVILLSPVASNLKVSKEQGALSVRYGGAGAVFGMPEFIVPFNKMLAEVAAGSNCYYVDMYTPTKENAALASWYIRDGVHLTPAGHQMFASLVLKALASENSPLKNK